MKGRGHPGSAETSETKHAGPCGGCGGVAHGATCCRGGGTGRRAATRRPPSPQRPPRCEPSAASATVAAARASSHRWPAGGRGVLRGGRGRQGPAGGHLHAVFLAGLSSGHRDHHHHARVERPVEYAILRYKLNLMAPSPPHQVSMQFIIISWDVSDWQILVVVAVVAYAHANNIRVLQAAGGPVSGYTNTSGAARIANATYRAELVKQFSE